ncbi:MAG: hypothetical protein FJW95_17015, partial [Actinobacteria bacterium]|nr:hypothetical protein [Actinomycetota bacterium]
MRTPRVAAADPDHVTLRHATRTLVVGLAVFVVLGWVLDRPDAAPAGLFSVFCLGAQADFVGTPRRRAQRYLLVGTVSVLMIPLGAGLEDWPVAVVALTGAVVFTTMFLAALGGPFYAARFPIVVALLLSVTTESSADLVAARTVGWLCGTLAITVAALVLWPARAPSAVPELTADVCRRAARMLRDPA